MVGENFSYFQGNIVAYQHCLKIRQKDGGKDVQASLPPNHNQSYIGASEMTFQIVTRETHNTIGACPFCGSAESEVVQTHSDVFVVQCDGCLSQGPGRETAARSLEAWSMRAVRPYIKEVAA